MSYQGWKNYETWNCALWINNDYPLYISARIFMQAYEGTKPYRDWVKIAGLENEATKDGCKWLSSKLSYAELNDMMKELRAWVSVYRVPILQSLLNKKAGTTTAGNASMMERTWHEVHQLFKSYHIYERQRARVLGLLIMW